MDGNLVFTGAVQLLVLLLAVSAHEAAHAHVAGLCGDPTARLLGRASLNPLRHADLLGTAILPLLLIAFGQPVFGWGRPAPVTATNLRRPGWDEMRIAAAGPAANMLLSLAGTVALAVAVRALGPEAGQAARLSLFHSPRDAYELAGFPVVFTLVQLAWVNAFLAVFNLMPLPPLDGGRIVLQLLPPEWVARYSALRPYGFMIVFAMALSGVLSLLLLPIYVVLMVISS